jgi:hypothetical protein
VHNFSHPDRAWNPLDGRITELGMHLTEDHALRNDVVIEHRSRTRLTSGVSKTTKKVFQPVGAII